MVKKLSEQKKRELRLLYDSFEVKNMSFVDFIKAHERLLDPATMQEDFNRICHQRHNAGIIDTAIKDNRG
jgi:hypothetical protein